MWSNEYNNWLSSSALTEAETAELNKLKDNEEQLQDAFGASLKFGTAGLRGIMGLGTNRMNIYVVRKATQGLANYLNSTCRQPSVVVSYDSRLNSRSFAEETACVLTANNIRTYIFEEMMPVPVLSYAVRHLECSAGIMITASHNPKEYNGYKVYNSTGGQILDKEADSIYNSIEAVDIFNDIKTMTFEAALKSCCSYTDEAVFTEYMNEMDKVSDFTKKRNLNIVYSPLNGSGNKPVQEILTRNGFEYFVVPEQEQEDGNFTTCPSPNPEKAEVYEIALRYAQQQNADIIITTDPDCDRVGAMVKHNDDYTLLTGNQIGILLFHYICEASPDVSQKTLCTTIVSTPLVNEIAADYDVNVKRTLVGFKYIGQQIDLAPDKFILGFEESNGYLIGDYARDKDGVVAVKLFCQMAAFYKSQNQTPVDVLGKLYDKYGYTVDKTVTIDISGETEKAAIMKKIRNHAQLQDTFAAMTGTIDYSDETTAELTGLPLADVVQIDFEDKSRIIVRPSGTEPKIKMYLSASEKTKAKSTVKIEELLQKIKDLINS